MRGKAEKNGIFRPGVGITPAYAGKSYGCALQFRDGGDHPRVCGEKIDEIFLCGIFTGSPPRMRGKDILLRKTMRSNRITPAYAGKSVPCYRSAPASGDHPRVCGEKTRSPSFIVVKRGSPPRMRGKGKGAAARKLRAGITPAYAGKSLRHCCFCVLHRDHPRVCGEKTNPALPGITKPGSPPRMRGKVENNMLDEIEDGITPAYAGKSLHCKSSVNVLWDHPRVCGEKWGGWYQKGGEKGSPPRMRGKAFYLGSWQCANRITPAYAGKSIWFQLCAALYQDHPRVCGEKSLADCPE